MKLTLANTAAARTPRISGVSPAASRAQQNFAGLAQAFRALPMTSKSTWQLAANQLNADQARTGRHKLSAQNAYTIINSARLPFQLPLLADAPADLNPPPLLQNVTAVAGATSAGNDTTGDPAFTLTLHAPDYNFPVQVLAAPPAPIGKPTYPDDTYAPLAALPGLTPQGTDIGPAYQTRYGTPEPGSQLALKLIAVSPVGVRRGALILAADLPAPAAQTGHADTHLHIA